YPLTPGLLCYNTTSPFKGQRVDLKSSLKVYLVPDTQFCSGKWLLGISCKLHIDWGKEESCIWQLWKSRLKFKCNFNTLLCEKPVCPILYPKLIVFATGSNEEIIPVSTNECEITRQEEATAEQRQQETTTHANKSEEFQMAGAPEETQMLEPKEQIKADMQLEERENVEEEEKEMKVQLVENKKENGGESPLKKQENAKEESPPTSPSFNSQAEKPEEQPGSGKKNDISRHSYSRYNTISYRKIRKGNTKQRIDEFESMMHL
uniref:Ermin n=1 Tax=Pelusios castaneus TaxID=367368 RepID=A0A8C8R7V8_9SAUR